MRRLGRNSAACVVAGAALVFAGAPGSATAAAPDRNPAGNNGSFQVDGWPFDGGSGNEPHVACAFRLAFFGFDTDQRGSIEIAGQSPSGNGQVGGLSDVVLSDDDASGGGQDADAVFDFTAADLQLSGLRANTQQGYHLKVTVTTGAPGGVKSKVFWLQPCDAPPPPPPPPT